MLSSLQQMRVRALKSFGQREVVCEKGEREEAGVSEDNKFEPCEREACGSRGFFVHAR